jgi:K+-transporting ATPase ATPase A chain
MNATLQYIFYLAILVLAAIPLGSYMAKIMNGEKVFLSPVLTPCENLIYRILRVDKNEQMTWKKYAASALAFSGFSLLILFLILKFQNILPFNPEHVPGNSWHLAFNTAVSFVTNTNWQSYSAEGVLSYFSQFMGLTVQNFVTPAVGGAVMFALIRGFTKVKETGLGSFWADVTRYTLYILIPICLVASLVLVSQGVVQSFDEYQTVSLVEPITLEDGTEVTEQVLPLGPAASQIAIKQLGTNGGGFQGTNSAHPFENPTPFSNLIEMIFLLVLPVAFCFTFGKCVKDKRQGYAIFLAMFIMLVISLAVVAVSEQAATPQMAQGGTVDITASEGYSGGNMEGKETRFGIPTSVTWAAFTTAASNGSVNSMHDSYTPIGGMIPMLLMMLGEVVFGGVGCGLYGMIGFVIMTVFIAGLMVGRTPEYLGKKIEPYEMKMAVLVCLATPIAVLIGSGVLTLLPSSVASLNNPGAHGLSEILYAFASAGGNNGSAFAGLNCNTPSFNVALGLAMLLVRFLPMVATLAIAGSLARKKKVAVSAGTLSTCNAMFVFLLIMIVLLIGALSFFPALALGPIAEFFQMLA